MGRTAKSLLLLSLFAVFRTNGNDLSFNPGHLRPFGCCGVKHSVKETEGFPSNEVFTNDYIKTQQPLKMEGAAKLFPAFIKWTDEYLSNEHGNVHIGVEPKKEHRTMAKSGTTMKEYISTYKNRDVYSISPLHRKLEPDVLVPCPIQCEDLREKFVQTSMWFSNGGTKGSFHIDTVENIICLLRGRKTFTMIEYDKYKDVVDYSEYPYLDVDAVDFTVFPWMDEVELHQVNLTAGDCLYIPYSWFHQVNSYDNNLAVSQQWKHEVEFNPDTYSRCRPECDPNFTADTVKTMGYMELDELPDMVRERLMSMFLLQDELDKADLYNSFFGPEKDDLLKVQEFKNYVDRFIATIDSNKDGKVSKDEIPLLSEETLRSLGADSNIVFKEVEEMQKVIWEKAKTQTAHSEL